MQREDLRRIDDDIAQCQEKLMSADDDKILFSYADDQETKFDPSVDALSFCSEMCLERYLLSPVG